MDEIHKVDVCATRTDVYLMDEIHKVDVPKGPGPYGEIHKVNVRKSIR